MCWSIPRLCGHIQMQLSGTVPLTDSKCPLWHIVPLCTKARSPAGGYFFFGSIPHNEDPIKLNGAIHITCTILKLVAASAAEAELGALFLNAQEAKVLPLILAELGHPQPPTLIHIDITTTVGIVNNMIKCQQSRAMEMRYFGYWTVKHNDTSNSTTNPASKT